MRKLPQLHSGQQAAKAKKNPAGQGLNHESAVLHVTGKARYVDDLPTPANTLHAYVGLATQAQCCED